MSHQTFARKAMRAAQNIRRNVGAKGNNQQLCHIKCHHTVTRTRVYTHLFCNKFTMHACLISSHSKDLLSFVGHASSKAKSASQISASLMKSSPTESVPASSPVTCVCKRTGHRQSTMAVVGTRRAWRRDGKTHAFDQHVTRNIMH